MKNGPISQDELQNLIKQNNLDRLEQPTPEEAAKTMDQETVKSLAALEIDKKNQKLMEEICNLQVLETPDRGEAERRWPETRELLRQIKEMSSPKGPQGTRNGGNARMNVMSRGHYQYNESSERGELVCNGHFPQDSAEIVCLDEKSATWLRANATSAGVRWDHARVLLVSSMEEALRIVGKAVADGLRVTTNHIPAVASETKMLTKNQITANKLEKAKRILDDWQTGKTDNPEIDSETQRTLERLSLNAAGPNDTQFCNRRIVHSIEEEAHNDASRQLKPLSALGRAILLASERCRDGTKPWIITSKENDRHRVEAFAFDEFVYFFMHFTMRLAFTVMTDAEKNHLGKHLLRYVASVSVDACFEHVPEDLRKKMILEFCTNLQTAERQYASCAPSNFFAGPEGKAARELDALFITLGDNVAQAIGHEGDGELKLAVAGVAAKHLTTMDLLRLILDFKENNLGLSDDYLEW